jgi:hypothetical protein
MSVFDNTTWHVYSVTMFNPFKKEWVTENRYYMKEVELKENKFMKDIQYLGVVEKKFEFSTEREFDEE